MSAFRPPRAAAAQLNPAARTTVALLFAAWFVDYLDRLAITFVLPSIGKEFGLDLGQQGLVISVFFVAYAASQLPGGMLADRFGAKRVTCWALLIWSLFTALTGLSWSFAALLVVRFTFGVAEGIFPPASAKALVERTTVAERMGAQGIVMSASAVASVVAPLAVAPLAAAVGWRSSFFTIALAGGVVYAAVRMWLPGPRDRSGAGGRPAAAAPVRAVLRTGVLWRFALMMSGYGAIAWGLTTWVPSYLSEQPGVSGVFAGLLMALPALGAALATVWGGRLADRYEGRHRKVIVPAMSVAAPALLLMAWAPGPVGALVFATVAIFAAALCYMPIMAVPLRSFAPEESGIGSAVVVFGGQLAGVIAPPLLGLIAQTWSFRVAFAFLALGPVLTGLVALITPQDTASYLAAAARQRGRRTGASTGPKTELS
ncbi:MFS transporter [Streptomyces sp. NPDC058000]|uniref:MFS transporter n=1 Tax=Streptomyces sp. NPDC058000 TaxID=3346299 RepID=UPI0036E56951